VHALRHDDLAANSSRRRCEDGFLGPATLRVGSGEGGRALRDVRTRPFTADLICIDSPRVSERRAELRRGRWIRIQKADS
jgi:hypothetical protein